MSSWWFDHEMNDGAAGRLFPTIDAVFALKGERLGRDPLCEVVRIEHEGVRYYAKRYAGNGKNARKQRYGLRQWLVPPRVKIEWRNLLLFHQWGIPTARLAAYGLERERGAYRRGALITEEIRNACDLAQLVRRHDARLHDARWVAKISSQVAQITRRMHVEGFVHNDLKWRNLLVTDGDTPMVYLIDCPSGGFWYQPFLSYRIIKDLACLDKVAKRLLRRSQRLHFYLDYVQRDRLNPGDKERVRRIVKFFEGRE